MLYIYIFFYLSLSLSIYIYICVSLYICIYIYIYICIRGHESRVRKFGRPPFVTGNWTAPFKGGARSGRKPDRPPLLSGLHK